MKEGPIPFNGEMVRAILDGRKTMARRVVKPQPDLSSLKPEYRDLQFEFRRMPVLGPTHIPSEWGFCAKYDKPNCVPIYGYRCPYGQPGDRLWVRETWGETESGTVCYRADEPLSIVFKWHHSIYMPREVSRIMLEITDIRVERVQDISEADADAEAFGGDFPAKVLPGLFPGNADDWSHLSIPECFAVLWDSIYGKKPGRSWADNPWVWVISFKRIGG